MDKLNVIILAAGKGTRMYSNIPKVLHRVAGRHLLQHVLACRAELSPDRTFVVYGHGGNLVQDSILDHNVHWLLQEQQLGTGHAVQQALPFLDSEGVSLILLGDVPLICAESCHRLINVVQGGSARICVLSCIKSDPTGYGRIVRNTQGSVIGIVEEKDADSVQKQIKEVSSGIMAVSSALLCDLLPLLSNRNAQQEYYLTDIIGLAAQQGIPVKSEVTDENEVMGVNSKQDLACAERIYQQRQTHALMKQGVTLMDPQRVDIRGELICGQDVSIDVGCVFEGRVVLENQVSVGAYCILKEVTIGAESTIHPYSMLEQCETAQRCQVGPYARIRPGSKLGLGCQIGNFVEVKNSQLGSGSRARHLSYLGDAQVGQQVNIGAGTITCNYDGANKYTTTIGDNAFIGSGSQLVAPVTIGAGATIGAGSTITKNAPDNQLSLTRAQQITIASWVRPK